MRDEGDFQGCFMGLWLPWYLNKTKIRQNYKSQWTWPQMPNSQFNIKECRPRMRQRYYAPQPSWIYSWLENDWILSCCWSALYLGYTFSTVPHRMNGNESERRKVENEWAVMIELSLAQSDLERALLTRLRIPSALYIKMYAHSTVWEHTCVCRAQRVGDNLDIRLPVASVLSPPPHLLPPPSVGRLSFGPDRSQVGESDWPECTMIWVSLELELRMRVTLLSS